MQSEILNANEPENYFFKLSLRANTMADQKLLIPILHDVYLLLYHIKGILGVPCVLNYIHSIYIWIQMDI